MEFSARKGKSTLHPAMIFTTHWFLFFSVLSIGFFWLLPGGKLRLWFLGAACAVFHTHVAGPAGVLPIALLMVVTYFAGRSGRPAFCVAAIAVCVAALVFYKYTVFLIGAAVQPWNLPLAESLQAATNKLMPGLPPLAVSFFTFEFVHYLYDVKRGGEPIRSPLKFVLFAIFFPSLVAGPIKRYTQFLPEMERAAVAQPASHDFALGAGRIGLGFFKKLILADNLTLWIESIQPTYAQETLAWRWMFLGALALRILFDFSGYSDIAIGTARLLGVRLPENFNWPYAARNLQDFWQRWHISLSSWIRDYVYIPLGGNRRGHARRILNGLIAFGLCGLWHGPAWHFVVWGVFHGAGLAICATYARLPALGPVIERTLAREPFIAWALTQVYVCLGWLLFFYPAGEAIKIAALLVSSR